MRSKYFAWCMWKCSEHICRETHQVIYAWVKMWSDSIARMPGCARFYSEMHETVLLNCATHYRDVIIGVITSQITGLTIVYSTDYSIADQRKHLSSASLAFVRGNHRGPWTSPHKWPVTRKMFPFDDVIMSDAWGPVRLTQFDSLIESVKTTSI